MRRNSWTLPALLVILLAALIVGVIVESRVRNSSSPTPTPSGHQGATNSTAVPAGSTPTPKKGVSTPLPGTTPVPTVPGLHLGMITHKASDIKGVQALADQGNPNYTWYRNPVTVARKKLPDYGFVPPIHLVQPTSPQPTPTAYKDQTGRPTVKVLIRYNGKYYTAFLGQPGKTGPKGIWVLLTILQGRQ